MAPRHQAGYTAKKRNAHNRPRKSVILIMAEGNNKTETQYFQDFARAYGKKVMFVPENFTDPVKMTQALIKEYHKSELNKEYGDIGFCLIDSDFNYAKDAQIAAADKLAAKENIKILVSSPCFEIWFLCHFHANAKKYRSNEEVLAELKEQFEGYQKSMPEMFAKTQDRLTKAIKNAQILRDVCEQSGYTYHTVDYLPSTEIDELAMKLMGGMS